MEVATQICQKLTDALNRWPDINDISAQKRGKTVRSGTNVLFDAAVRSVCPHSPTKAPAPRLELSTSAKDPRMSCFIFIIDPNQNYKGVRKHLVVPEIADVPEARNIILNHIGSNKYEGDDNGTFKSVVDQQVLEGKITDLSVISGLKLCERYLRYLIEENGRLPRFMSVKDYGI